uniref:Peptidase A1 domain-containing protein n=1 Tax=Oryza punctata TaxID=4537 RepID=A0A0E0L1Z5_ORYPU
MAIRIPAVDMATASLMILILMPRMVTPGILPQFRITPKANKPFGRDFFRDRALDMAGQAGSNPGEGDGGNNADHTREPATTFGDYVISLDVGTPPQSVSGAIDVSTELVWVPCSECLPKTLCDQAKQATPGIFLKSRSTSFIQEYCKSPNCQAFVQQTCSANVLCEYSYMYGGDGGKTTYGNLSMEKFTIGSTQSQVSFGCGTSDPNRGDFYGQPGVIGLNKGRFSLPSQLRLERFSYYFAPEHHAGDSVFRFGNDAVPQTNNPRYTPFLTSGAGATSNPLMYWVGIAGIQVGGRSLPISSGASIDVCLSTSVPVTVLEKSTYGLLREELISTVGSDTADGSALGLDLCYTGGSREFPDMALVFAGGAVMELQPRNYLYRDTSTGLECLTILPSQDAGELSLLGSLIQTGTHMIYDIKWSRLGFESIDRQSNRPSTTAAPPRVSPAATIACFVWAMGHVELVDYSHVNKGSRLPPMADRIPAVAVAIAIASLILVVTPEMVSSGFIPRFKLSPKANNQIRDIIENHAADLAGLAAGAIPSEGDGSSSDPSWPPATTVGTYLIAVGVAVSARFRNPQYVSGAFDITSEFVWVPCE